ncbi:MAG: amidophosphoribosyltransferase [Kiritimatiellae bacterium]|nr:amidophosphoribosyltransferase [Kiritimatiellia bacterium]
MSDEIKHECGVALLRLLKDGAFYREKHGTADWGGTKLSLLLEKQHNRGQDGAGAAILRARPVPGTSAYMVTKSASPTPLVDLLAQIAKRQMSEDESIFLGHLRYATFGKGDTSCCHPFVHKSSCLARTLILAGNFNLTNNAEIFSRYVALGHHPDSRADGYLLTQLMAHHLGCAVDFLRQQKHHPLSPQLAAEDIAKILANTLENADGAWTLCGMTGDGWSFATRDPHGIRPGFYFVNDEVAVVASERPAIQAAFDVPSEAVKEIPPGAALVISPDGEVKFENLTTSQTTQTTQTQRSCVFERIYFSRANDADIHRERKALGAALLPQILDAAGAPMEDIFFSYIPNSARIAFHGLIERLFTLSLENGQHPDSIPRFGEIAVKDAKFRTFIADAAARREFYKHVYDVTYGLVRPGVDTLVVLDDSIVRGNTMKRAILPMLDRLGPKRIVIASSSPPIRYPDCYGIDMSTLGELVAFRALVNLLGPSAESELRAAHLNSLCARERGDAAPQNPLEPLYARFTPEQHTAEIARLLTPPDLKAEVKVVFQTVESLHASCPNDSGDWYFTGEYPTPGGYRVLRTALAHYLENNNERSY